MDQLSEDAVRVYGMIARQERIPEANKSRVRELVAWGFVGFDPEHPDVPVALDPKEAVQRRLAAELAEAQQRVARMTALPAVSEQLSAHYERAQWHGGAGSEYLDDPAVVNARLEVVVGSAREEILAAQPGGPRNRDVLTLAVSRDSAALARGITLRTLYRDTVRDHALTAEYAATMSAKGAAYRTLVSHFERCIVVDRRVAFISDYVVEGAPEHAAWQITDRAMVAFIVATFDNDWRRATLWHGELRCRRSTDWGVDTVTSSCGLRTSERQRVILRHLAEGIPQAVIARRIGMSPRKLTDEITELKALWNVDTLPELIYQWALSPDRVVDDRPAGQEHQRQRTGDGVTDGACDAGEDAA